MGEDLLDFARQPAPVRDDRSGAGNRSSGPSVGPRRARQLEGRGEKASAAGGGERETRRRNGGRRKPRPAGAVSPSPRRAGDRPQGLRRETPRNRRRADRSRKRDCGAGRGLRRCPSAPERNRPPCGLAPARAPPPRVRLARGRSALPAQGAAPECGRYCHRRARSGGQRRSPRSRPRYRRRRREARASSASSLGNRSAASSDLLGAGVQVSRSRIIAETRERAHHGFERGRGQVLDPRPFRDEGLIIGRRRLRRRLLQQHFGEPDPVGIGRFPRFRAPGERAAVAVPPCKRTGDDRLSLCLGR